MPRNIRLFSSTEDLARRSGLDRGDLSALAAADALAGLTGHRRTALWETLAIDEATRLALPAITVEPPRLVEPTEGENIVADYETLGLTLRRHPLALLRDRLKKRSIRTAERSLPIAPRPIHSRSRDRHVPPTPGDRERRDLRDARRRDGLREPDRVERPLGAPASRASRIEAARRERRSAEGRKRRPYPRSPPRGSLGRCWAGSRRRATTSTETSRRSERQPRNRLGLRDAVHRVGHRRVVRIRERERERSHLR